MCLSECLVLFCFSYGVLLTRSLVLSCFVFTLCVRQVSLSVVGCCEGACAWVCVDVCVLATAFVSGLRSVVMGVCVPTHSVPLCVLFSKNVFLFSVILFNFLFVHLNVYYYS